MPEVGHIETCVASEGGWITLPAQENDDLLIFQTLCSNVDPNLPRRYPGSIQQQALPFQDVFVEYDQA